MASTINATTTNGVAVTGDTSGSLALQTNNGTTAVTIDSSQNVGIGTASPSYKLDVVGGINSSGNISTASGNFVLGANDTYLGFASNNIKFNNTSDRITMTTGATERMRIDSSGNVLIGTTNSSATAGIGIKLNYDAAGNIIYCVTSATTNAGSNNFTYYSTGAAAYRFYVGAGGTVFATSTTISAISDQRLKENVKDLDVGLNEIMQLKPRTFDWKEGKGKDIKGDRGFIAQEFEQIFPDLVDEWKDEPPEGEDPYKSVRQDLIPVLVKSIQELKAIVDAQQQEINALKGVK